jgi:pimeloyl-ACP methyl ester carboxylesterase
VPGDDETAGLPQYTELVVDAMGSHPEVVLVAGSLGGFTAPLVCARVSIRELVLINEAWPPIGIRVLAGRDDRFFPAGLQRRVARDRLGVEADVLPGGYLLPLAQPRLVADYLLETSRPGDVC